MSHHVKTFLLSYFLFCSFSINILALYTYFANIEASSIAIDDVTSYSCI